MLFRLLLVFLFLTCSVSFAQKIDTVYVSHDKTTYVMFSDDIDVVDIGNKEYAYVANANMVLFKALRENAQPTSLMVKTKTAVKVWMIAYKKSPQKILIDTRPSSESYNQPVVQNTSNSNTGNTNIQANANSKPEVRQSTIQNGYVSAEAYQKRMEEKYSKTPPYPSIATRTANGNRDAIIHDNLMQQKVHFILNQRKFIKDIGEIDDGLYFSLHDVYVDRNFIYIKLGIENTTSIAFDLDFISFERSQGRSLKKREGTSQGLLNLSNRETVFTVAPSAEEVVVYILDLFAFQENDMLLVKLNELGGVRTLKFSIPAKIVMQAKTL